MFASLTAAAAGDAPVPHIAYVTATTKTPLTVWSSDLDGSHAVRLGPGSAPLLSPDGLMVAASLFGTAEGLASGPELAVYSTVGAGAKDFPGLGEASAEPLAWSPDSRYLAIDVESGAIHNAAQLSALEVLDLTTGALTTISHGQIYGASFAPDGSDRLVYAKAPSRALKAPVNLFTAMPDGNSPSQLTSDGRSLYPLWGRRYLAYDRERLRRNAAPVFQIWLRPTSLAGAIRRLSNLRVSQLVSGLIPIAFSADGSRLLSEFVGQDTSEAWVIRTSTGAAKRLSSHGRSVVAAGISADGSSVLIDEGSFEEAPSSGRIASKPFAGGPAKVLVAHGSQASWNG